MSDDQRRCTATTAKGAACRNRPMPGMALCAKHLPTARAGGAPRAQTVDKTLTDNLARLLRAGNYVVVACQAAGISKQRFYDWLEFGDPAGTDPAHAPYREFRAEIEKARAEGEARNVAIVAQAAATNWQAAAWLLERSQPERWDKPSQRQRLRERSAADVAAGAPVKPEPPADEFTALDELAARRRQAAK